jgi:hypothetical protein
MVETCVSDCVVVEDDVRTSCVVPVCVPVDSVDCVPVWFVPRLELPTVEVPMVELPIVELFEVFVEVELDGSVDDCEVPEFRLPEAEALPEPLRLPDALVVLLDVLGTVMRKSFEPVLEVEDVPD